MYVVKYTGIYNFLIKLVIGNHILNMNAAGRIPLMHWQDNDHQMLKIQVILHKVKWIKIKLSLELKINLKYSIDMY